MNVHVIWHMTTCVVVECSGEDNCMMFIMANFGRREHDSIISYIQSTQSVHNGMQSIYPAQPPRQLAAPTYSSVPFWLDTVVMSHSLILIFERWMAVDIRCHIWTLSHLNTVMNRTGCLSFWHSQNFINRTVLAPEPLLGHSIFFTRPWISGRR